MQTRRLLTSLLVATVLAASSVTAVAGDHRHRSRSDDNKTGAIIAAGIIGAVIIGSMMSEPKPQPAPPVVYAPPQPEPQPVYAAPAPVHYPPPQVYYPQPQVQPGVVYVERPYYERREYRRYRGRDGYYRY